MLKVWLVTSHWCIKIFPLHIYGCEISLTWHKKFLVTSHWCIRNFSHVTYLGMWWHDVSWIMGLYAGRFGEEEEEREITCHPHESYTWSSLPMKYKTQKLDFELQRIPRNSFFYQLRYSPKWAVPHAAISEALLYFHGDPLLRFHTLSTLQSSDCRFVSVGFLSFLFLVPFNSITDCLCFTEIKSYEPG